MAKRGLCLLLALATLFSLSVPAFAEEEAEEVLEVEAQADEPMPAAEFSDCGDGVTYNLTDDGVLTISGNGAIAGSAFSGRSDIKTVIIESGVTGIGDSAFSDCLSLTSVTIPEGVTSIGYGAFYDTGLTNVTIPEGVTSIADNMFAYCFSLTSVTIPDTVTSIGYGAFSYCGLLTNVTIPSSVTSIGQAAFFGTGLTSVTIPGSVTSIGNLAFFECFSLANVTIQEGVTSIGEFAFCECTALTSVTIPNSVTNIEERAFSGCTSLSSVTVLNPKCVIAKPEKNDYGETLYTLGDPETTIICGHTDSTAEWHASHYNYMFRSIDQGTELAAPTVTIVRVSDGIQVTWNKVTGAPRYMVYYRENGGGWKQIGTTTETTYTRKAANLKSGVKYQFTVRCCANDKKTMLSPYVGSNTLYYTANLSAPTVKIAKAADGIKVSWNKIDGAPRYMVYYRENGGSWKKIGTTTATTYTRKAAQLKSGATYQFTVRCCANDKKTMLGPYKASNSITYTAQLAAPTVKIAKVAGGIKVSWNKITGSPRYMVYYKENSGGWVKIGTTTATSYTRAAKYLKNGVTYAFTVRCCENDKKTLLGPYKASNSLKYMK